MPRVRLTAWPPTARGFYGFEPQHSSTVECRSFDSTLQLGACTAADRRVVEADVAAAAALAALRQAVAAGLDHRAASFVAAGAADAATVFGVFALANTHRQIALAARDTVQRAAAAA
jgi:hypothetical protein